MLVKQLAKSMLRGLAIVTHKLGFDSRTIGPPFGQSSSHELTGSKLTIYPLRIESMIQRSLPNTLEPEIDPKFYLDLERKAPACYIAEIIEGRSFGTQGVVLSADDIIIGDLCPVIASPSPEHRDLYRLKFPKVRFLSGRVGLIAGSGSEGYFHWLYDVFPKLALLEQLENKPERYIISNYRKSFVEQSIYAAGLSRDQIIPADNHSHFQAEKLLAPSPPCFTGNPPPWIVKFLRKTFLKEEIFNEVPKRIYISRQDATYRKITNEMSVQDFLKSYGFEVIILSQLSLLDQVNIFNQASIIVSPHGAGLSNLAFCNPQTKVIEIFHPDYVNVCYWSISNLLNLNYWYCLGVKNVSRKSDLAPFAQNIQVDIAKLSKLIEKLIQQS